MVLLKTSEEMDKLMADLKERISDAEKRIQQIVSKLEKNSQ